MEALLKEFMGQLNNRFDNLENKFSEFQLEVRKDINELRQDVVALNAGQEEMRKDIGIIQKDIVGLRQGQEGLKIGLNGLEFEQSEMRKEVAFYYGSMMRQNENTRLEMRSSFKQMERTIKEHRKAINMLSKRS